MELWISQMGNPTLLFFALGMIAAAVRSDLEIPPAITKFVSLYLLLAIGFKGGQQLAGQAFTSEHASILALGLGSAFLIPWIAFALLKKSLGAADAGAVAAAYGSVSAVTFVAAGTFLDHAAVQWDGVMVAVMAAMEIPAIVIGVYLVQRFDKQNKRASSWKSLLHHALTNGSVLLLAGSFVIGSLSDPKQAEGIRPFTSDLFKGFLALFLLEMGRLTATKLKGFRAHGLAATLFAILFPLACGTLMAIVSGYWVEGAGNRLILAVLAGSASYIAAPAAMAKAAPQANPGLYVPMALGITFPMNLILGLPIYWHFAQI